MMCINCNKSTKPSPNSKATTTTDKQSIISKKDYQHLLHLLQQSKKNASTLNPNKHSPTNTPHLVLSIFNIGNDLNQSCIWILDSGALDVFVTLH